MECQIEVFTIAAPFDGPLAKIARPNGVVHRLSIDNTEGGLRLQVLQSQNGTWHLPPKSAARWQRALNAAQDIGASCYRLLSISSHDVQALWIDTVDGNDVLIPIFGCIQIPEISEGVAIGSEQFLEILENHAPLVKNLEQKVINRKKIQSWRFIPVASIIVVIALYIYCHEIQSRKGESGSDLRISWALFEIAMMALLLAAGYYSKGRVDGIFIDDRNRISLSRFQSIPWFLLIFGLYLFEIMWNISGNFQLPTADSTLWGLLGVSLAAPVASNSILSAKGATAFVQPQVQYLISNSTAGPLPDPTPPPGQALNIGVLDRNIDSDDASWSDLYMGEEVANHNTIDISRYQQFFATIALAISFAIMAFQDLIQVQGALSMPNPNSDFLWLAGLSTGIYVLSKAAPKTPS